jgi:predicted transcriptional regulator
MSDRAEIDDVVTKRADVLRALLDGPATKPELVRELDSSRSTVDRAIGELERHGLVHRPGDDYEVTLVGRHAYREYDAYLDTLGELSRAGDILTNLDPNAPFDPGILAGAEVSPAPAHAPERALDRALELIRNGDTFRATAPVVLRTCFAPLAEAMGPDGLTVELVVTGDVLAALETEFRDVYDAFRESDAATLLRYRGSMPYSLFVAETDQGVHGGLTVYSDTGVHGNVVNDADRMVAWVRDRYASYRDAADPVSGA